MRTRLGFAALALGLAAAFQPPGAAAQILESQLLFIRDGVEARRDAMLEAMLASVFPGDDPSNTQVYVWHRTNFALAALHQNVQLAQANIELREVCQRYIDFPEFVEAEFGMHWTAQQIARAYLMFHSGSAHFPGRLEPATEECLRATMWTYLRQASDLAKADHAESLSWRVRESENHHIMMTTAYWIFSQILEDDPLYASQQASAGGTPQEHHAAWTEYLNVYLTERAAKGGFIEMGSPTYSKYTLTCVYSMADFAEDDALRARARMFLDLYWTAWAQEQIGGVRGGAKARCFPDGPAEDASDDSAMQMAWFALDIGTELGKHPGVIASALTDYRMPLVVMDIALDYAGRGDFVSRQRRPGLAQDGFWNAPDYKLRQDFGGIVRYTYTTPEFILGVHHIPARPYQDWTAISSQSRWQGIILAGPEDGRVFVQSEPEGTSKTLNADWSVASEGAMIVQQLETSRSTSRMRTFFSTSGLEVLNDQPINGWIFARGTETFVAVRVPFGSTTWEPAPLGRYLVNADRTSPVVIQVAPRSDFLNTFEFQQAIFAQPFSANPATRVVQYTNLSGNTLKFFGNQASPQTPQVNGQPIDLLPPKTWDSPFLQGDWDSGIVTIQKGTRSLRLDFDNPLAGPHNGWALR